MEHAGAQGTSYWRTFEAGKVRVRLVEYTAGFISDHYCGRGHVVLVLEGGLKILMKDGISRRLISGMSFQAPDDEKNPHKVSSKEGAKVFIVD